MFATYKGGLNGGLFVSLLRRLMRGRRRSLHLIVDGLPAHKTKAVKNYVEQLQGSTRAEFHRNRRAAIMNTIVNNHSNNDLGYCLVTGAAGYVGRHLVQALLQRGLKVRALVRSTPLKLEHANLDCFSG